MAKLKDKRINSINALGKRSLNDLREVSKNVGDSSTQIEKKTDILQKEMQEIQTKKEQDLLSTISKEHKKLEYSDFWRDRPITEIPISLLDNAPHDWNIFPPLSETKMLYLKMSIENSGLFDPIIVKEKENGRYMIISGHNRVQAHRELLEEYNDDKYTNIRAIVYKKEELDDKKAKEMIIDTNFIQRGDFNSTLRTKILQARSEIYQTQKDKKSRNIKELAESFGIKKSAIYDDFAIIEKLHPQYKEQFFKNKMSRRVALKLAQFSIETQQWIIDTLPPARDDNTKLLKKNMTREQIEKIFLTDNSKKRTVKVQIPDERYDEFLKMYHNFLEKEENQ
jgi:ParB family chromosome partitioning protein